MGQTLLEAIRERVLLGDGAMGTQLQYAGLEPGGCGEAWNIDQPGRLLEIQKAYVDAGSDCLLTNTFGGCRIMLERHDRGDEVRTINQAGVELARKAFGGRPGFVLGDIGPFGGLMEPYGDIPDSGSAILSPSRPKRSLRPASTQSSSRPRPLSKSSASALRRPRKRGRPVSSDRWHTT